MIRKIILIPVYNDWSSLKILLENLNKKLKRDNYEIIIINDSSTIKQNISSNNYSQIKSIKILTLSKNVGSQRCIAIGLRYLSQSEEKKFIITIMDGDGEDDPGHVNNLIEEAEKNSDSIITANRLNRHEGKIFQFLYRIHLLITFILTFKWINFGNFTCLHSYNLKKMQTKNEIGVAVSASISKNCKIINSPSRRLKRYEGNSQVSYFGLFLHSLRILSVYYIKIFFILLIYMILTLIFITNSIKILAVIFSAIIIFDLILIMIYRNFKITEKDYNELKITEKQC